MRTWQRLSQRLLWLGILVFYSLPSMADDEFTIKSVITQHNESVYLLNVEFNIELPDYMTSAIDQGFDLPLALEVEVFMRRGFWFDKEIAYVKQQYRLQFHPLLDSVSVLDMNSGNRLYYSNLQQALEQVSILYNLPLLDKEKIDVEDDYRARLRFGVDDHELPLPLKSSSLWKKDWQLRSAWYEWEFPDE